VARSQQTPNLHSGTHLTPGTKEGHSSVGPEIEFTHIVVFEGSEHFEFPVDASTRDYILEDVWHLFKSFPCAVSWVYNRPTILSGYWLPSKATTYWVQGHSRTIQAMGP